MTDAERAPVLPADVASVWIGDEVVLAREGSRDPILLPPVEAVLWSSLTDGAPIDELAEDLATATGVDEAHASHDVAAFIERLAAGGFILDGIDRPAVPPRRFHPPIDPESCAGRKMGLGRATMIDVVVAGRPAFRLGSTDRSALDEVTDGLHPIETVAADATDPDAWRRTLTLRITWGRSRRLQQLFDTLGDPLHATFSPDEAVESAGRTAAGLVVAMAPEGRASVWVDGPALLGPEGITLLHPALAGFVLPDLRREILASSLRFVPSAIFELRMDGPSIEAVLPAFPTGGNEVVHPVTAVLVPRGGPASPGEALRRVAHLAAWWDQPHLEAMAALVGSPVVRFLPRDSALADLARLIGVGLA